MRDDESLSRELGTLPRAKASASFTDDVLARSNEPRPARIIWMKPALALALLVAAVAIPVMSRWSPQDAAKPDGLTTAELQRLRDRHRELRRELAELRQIARAGRPVVVLAGDDEVDVVLDLAQVVALPDFWPQRLVDQQGYPSYPEGWGPNAASPQPQQQRSLRREGGSVRLPNGRELPIQSAGHGH